MLSKWKFLMNGFHTFVHIDILLVMRW